MKKDCILIMNSNIRKNEFKHCYVDPSAWLFRSNVQDMGRKMTVASLRREWSVLSKPFTEAVLLDTRSKTMEKWFQTLDYLFEKWKFTEARVKKEVDTLYEQRRDGTYYLDVDLKEEDSTNQLDWITFYIQRNKDKMIRSQVTAKQHDRLNTQVKHSISKLNDLTDELESLKTKQMKSTQWSLMKKELHQEYLETAVPLDDLASTGVYSRLEDPVPVWNGPWAVPKNYQFSLKEFYGFQRMEETITFHFEIINEDIRQLAEKAHDKGTFTIELEEILSEMDTLLAPIISFSQNRHTLDEWIDYVKKLKDETPNFKHTKLYKQAEIIVDEGNSNNIIIQMDTSGKLLKNSDDGSLAWLMNKQLAVSAKGGGVEVTKELRLMMKKMKRLSIIIMIKNLI